MRLRSRPIGLYYEPVVHRRGDDFSVGGEKLVINNQDNQIQGTTLCNCILRKRYTQCKMGFGSRRIFENFCKDAFTVSYTINGSAGCTSCSPNNFVGAAPPVPRLCCCVRVSRRVFWDCAVSLSRIVVALYTRTCMFKSAEDTA